jgi:hypothetical protein
MIIGYYIKNNDGDSVRVFNDLINDSAEELYTSKYFLSEILDDSELNLLNNLIKSNLLKQKNETYGRYYSKIN